MQQKLGNLLAPLAILLTSGSAAAATSANAVLEVAPLAAATGQVSLGGEAPITSSVTIASYLEHREFAGERDRFRDREQGGTVLAQWYPWQQGEWAVFVGAGLGYDHLTRGRQQLADTMTWSRTTDDERYDRWSEHEQRIVAAETIGARVQVGEWLTFSFRYLVDQRLWSQREVVEDDINSLAPQLDDREFASANQRFGLYAGIRFP